MNFLELYLLTTTPITLFLASQTTQPILPLYITEKGATTLQLGIIIHLPIPHSHNTGIPFGAQYSKNVEKTLFCWSIETIAER